MSDVRVCIANSTGANSPIIISWGRFGLDRMFGENRLRVRELFPLINEQNKLNAKDSNVIVVDFRPAARMAA